MNNLMELSVFSLWISLLNFIWKCNFHFKGQNFNSTQYYLIPFYMMYSSFVPLHAKFASTLYRVGLRYRSLNKIICSNSSVGVCSIHLNVIFLEFWQKFFVLGERLTFFSLDKRSLAEFTTRLFTIDETLGQVVHHVQSYEWCLKQMKSFY